MIEFDPYNPRVNLLALSGHRPTKEVYYIKEILLLDHFKKIIKNNFDVDVEIDLRSGDDAYAINAYITDESFEELSDDVDDAMKNEGMDPSDSDEVTNYLTFELAGKQDAYMESRIWDADGDRIIEVFFNAREDLKAKSVELLEIALNGTRDETIIEINKLVRYIKGDAQRKKEGTQ